MSDIENKPHRIEIFSPREKVSLATAALKQIIEAVQERGIAVDVGPDGRYGLGPVLDGTVDQAKIFGNEYIAGWSSKEAGVGNGDFDLNINFFTDGAQSDMGFDAHAFITLHFSSKTISPVSSKTVNPAGRFEVQFKGEENKWYVEFDNSLDPTGNKPKEIEDLISKLGLSESKVEVDETKALDTIKELASFMQIKFTQDAEMV